MRPEDLLNIIVALFSFPVVFIILFKKPYKKVKIAYSIFALQGPLWALSITLFRMSTQHSNAILWARILYLIGTGVPILFLYFVQTFTKRKFHALINLLLLYGPLALFITFLFLTNDFIERVDLTSNGNFVALGIINILWVIWFSILMSIGILLLFITYRKSAGIEKTQIRFILLSVLAPMIASFPFNMVLPFFGVYHLIWIGPISLILMSAIIAYAILKHRLLGIKFVIGKFLYYLLTAAVPFSFFYLIAFIMIKAWGNIFAPGAIISGAAIAIAYIFIFWKIDELIRKFLEKALIYSEYDPFETINKLLKSTSTELNMEKVVINIQTIVRQTLSSEKTGIVIFDKNSRKVIYKKLSGFHKKATRNMRDLLEVVNFWDFQEQQGKESEILVFDEIASLANSRNNEEQKRLVKIINFMNDEEISVLLPLNRKVQLNGLMLVGQKENEEAYTVQDINLLESIVANASVAIGRSLLYHQVEGFAQNLEQKVDDATKELEKRARELSRKNIALERSAQRERDMMDIVGHELRTPATLVKNALGYIRMLIRMKKLSQTKLKQYINKAHDAIEREIKLINTFLGAAKIEGGQMQLDPTKFSLPELIKQVVNENKFSAHERGLKLTYKPTKENVPQIEADRTRIAEVIDNLISNAVKFTEKGKVYVWCDPNSRQKTVTVYVRDTGVGISKADQKRLFTKFGRVKPYTTEEERMAQIVRPGGTGLGLFLAKGIIELHGGDIGVKSTIGRGSSFHFTIPFKHKIAEKNLINPIFAQDGERDVFKKLGLNNNENSKKEN